LRVPRPAAGLGLLSLIGLLLAAAVTPRAEQAPWSLIRAPGHAVLMRHSDAPGSGGYGDPPGFRLEDCATQRNLSDEGRAHAHRTGEALRRNGVTFDRVLTSAWCRCRETARLAVGIDAEPMEALSNLVGRQQHAASQVAALKAFLAELGPGRRALLVTHGIVINALTGVSPAPGEMVIVQAGAGGEPKVVGRHKVE
jgi:phosphohistidine phosphatase SixA